MRLATVNKAIAHLNLELVKGYGYFWFDSPDLLVSSASVYVPRLNDLTLEQWVEEAEKVEKYTK